MTVIIALLILAVGVAFVAGWRIGLRRAHPPGAASPAGPQIAAPAIARISFELTIPQDTPPGEPLYLVGSFNGWNPADPQFQLQRVADQATGTWALSTSHVLEYKITRGSWQTVEKGERGVEITNRVLTPTADATVAGRVFEWTDRASPDQKIYDPRVERVTFASQALGVERTFYLYLPPEARADEAARFPSLYLLRGHEREWINKGEDQSRRGQRNVIDVYEELRAAGAIGPMVLVFPGMTSANGAIHSLGINMRAPELAKDPSIGSGRFEDYFFADLIPYLEANHPVLPGGEHRAIDGFSLGGFMSVNLALLRPGSFASVGAYDGLYFWDDPATGATVALTDTVFSRSLFDANFGVPRDRAYAAKHNPTTLLRANGVAAPEIQWLIEFGPEHAEPNVNFFRSDRLLTLLEERGAVNQLAGPLPDGIHNWQMADDHLRRALPLHWRRVK